MSHSRALEHACARGAAARRCVTSVRLPPASHPSSVSVDSAARQYMALRASPSARLQLPSVARAAPFRAALAQTPRRRVALPARPVLPARLARLVTRAAATPPEQSAEEEEEEANAAQAELVAADGDSTRAGAGAILARAGGVESQVAPKAAEMNLAVADLGNLAAAERELLLRAQALLRNLGVVAPPLAPPDDEEDADADGEDDTQTGI